MDSPNRTIHVFVSPKQGEARFRLKSSGINNLPYWSNNSTRRIVNQRIHPNQPLDPIPTCTRSPFFEIAPPPIRFNSFVDFVVNIEDTLQQSIPRMIQFFLLFNKLGQTRFAQYYTFLHAKERATLEGEVTRLYMGRREDQVGRRELCSHSSAMCLITGATDVSTSS